MSLHFLLQSVVLSQRDKIILMHLMTGARQCVALQLGLHPASNKRMFLKRSCWTMQAPVPVAIGGAGLPEEVVFRDDLPNAGLANITGTYLNLLGFTTPSHMEPSLI